MIEAIDLTWSGWVLRIFFGICTGFCIGLTGVGGGILVIPVLTVILGLDPVKAVGTTSLYAFLTKISALTHHAQLKTIDWKTALRFLSGAIPSNLFFAYWVSTKGSNLSFQLILQRWIVGVVFFSLSIMLINLFRASHRALETKERTLADRINGHPFIRSVLCVVLGSMVGGLVGATAIGGAVLVIPLLIILFDLPGSRTIGTSIVITFTLTMLTSAVYSTGGQIDLPTALIMAGGSWIGVYYGSRLSIKMPDRLLHFLVVALIALSATIMLIHSL